MTLDKDKLIETIEQTIKRTHSGEDTYTHNLKLQFENFLDMKEARDCLKRKYTQHFKISSEIELPNIDSSNKEIKYHVLMRVF